MKPMTIYDMIPKFSSFDSKTCKYTWLLIKNFHTIGEPNLSVTVAEVLLFSCVTAAETMTRGRWMVLLCAIYGASGRSCCLEQDIN